MQWDREVDVICAGSGGGGMSCAVTAAEAGATVLVAEKDKEIGGVQALSSGQMWLGGNRWAKEAGIEDSADETLTHLDAIANGLGSRTERENFVNRGQDAIEFLADRIGLQFRVIRDVPDYHYPDSPGSKAQGRYLEIEPFPGERLGEWAKLSRTSPYGDGYSYLMSDELAAWKFRGGDHIMNRLNDHIQKDERCAGAGLAAALLRAALDRNVEIMTETPVTRLIAEDGKVLGAVLSTPTGDINVRARMGVILAVGGYDWDADLYAHHETMPGAGSMCPPTVTGDHFALGADVGAIPVPAHSPEQSAIFVGYKVPTEEIYGQVSHRMYLCGYPHTIIVNKAGERFSNDASYPDTVTKAWRFDNQIVGYPNWPAWIVCDQDFIEKCSLLPSYPGQPLPEGMAVVADTLEELASKAGIEGEGLKATVDRWNGYCETGVDEEFHRENSIWGTMMTGVMDQPVHPNFGTIARGPFYAVPLVRVGMGVCTSGLRINENAQVINARGKPVEGLFAAGNSAAWTDMGAGYNSGISNMRSLLHGYSAAQTMTRNNAHRVSAQEQVA